MNWKIFNRDVSQQVYTPDKPCIFGIADLAFAGLVGSGANLIGNYANYKAQKAANETNLAIARETNQANLDLYREQYKNSIEQWNRENAYNDPAAQLRRYRLAGLNPSLQNGAVGTGVAGAASLPSASPMITGSAMQAPSFNFSDLAANVASMASGIKDIQSAKQIGIDNLTRDAYNKQQVEIAMQQLRNMKSSGELTKSESKLADKKLQQLGLEYDFMEQTFDSRKQSFELQNLMTEAQTDVLREQAKVFEQDKALKEIQAALTKEEWRYYGRHMQAVIDELYNRIAVGSSQILLNGANADYSTQQALESIEREKGIKIDNKVKQKTMKYVVAGAKSVARQQFYDSYRSKWDYQNSMWNSELTRAKVHGQRLDNVYAPIRSVSGSASSAVGAYAGARAK